VCSIPPSGRTQTSRGSGPVGDLGYPDPGNATEDRGSQDPLVGAACGSEGSSPDMPVVVGTRIVDDGSLALGVESKVEMMVAAEAASSPTADEVADPDLAAFSSGPTTSLPSQQPQVATASTSVGDDDNITEEPEARAPPSEVFGGCLSR
jgi:hypothetical protein